MDCRICDASEFRRVALSVLSAPVRHDCDILYTGLGNKRRYELSPDTKLCRKIILQVKVNARCRCSNTRSFRSRRREEVSAAEAEDPRSHARSGSRFDRPRPSGELLVLRPISSAFKSTATPGIHAYFTSTQHLRSWKKVSCREKSLVSIKTGPTEPKLRSWQIARLFTRVC